MQHKFNKIFIYIHIPIVVVVSACILWVPVEYLLSVSVLILVSGIGIDCRYWHWSRVLVSESVHPHFCNTHLCRHVGEKTPHERKDFCTVQESFWNFFYSKISILRIPKVWRKPGRWGREKVTREQVSESEGGERWRNTHPTWFRRLIIQEGQAKSTTSESLRATQGPSDMDTPFREGKQLLMHELLPQRPSSVADKSPPPPPPSLAPLQTQIPSWYISLLAIYSLMARNVKTKKKKKEWEAWAMGDVVSDLPHRRPHQRVSLSHPVVRQHRASPSFSCSPSLMGFGFYIKSTFPPFPHRPSVPTL